MLTRRLHKYILALLLLAGSILPAIARPGDGTIRKLGDSWQYYNPDYEVYVPYTAGAGYTTNVSLWLDSYHDHGLLELVTTPGLCLYLNNKLYYAYTKAGIFHINLENLYKAEGTRKLFVTLYQPNGKLNLKSTCLVNTVRALPVQDTYTRASYLPATTSVILKPLYGIDDLSVLVLLLIITAYIILKNFAPNAFMPLFSFTGYLNTDIQEYNNSNKRIDNTFMLMLVAVNCLCLAWLFYMGYVRSPGSKLGSYFFIQTRSFGISPVLVNALALGGGYLLFKLVIIYVCGALFNIGKISNPHYYEFTRFATLLSLLCLVLGLAVFQTHLLALHTFVNIVKLLVVIFFIIRVIKVSLLLNKLAGFKEIYLFSYLCTTEILPMMLIARFLA